MADYGSEYGGDLSIILIIIVVTVLLTNVMSDGAAAAILVPITLAVGAAADFNLAFIAIITAISTAFAFMTSFGTPPNLIVQASGIPTSNDFLRNGVPLVIIAILFLVSLWYSFTYINPSIIISLSSESVELNKEVIHFVSIAAGILIVGVLVSVISTYFALNKFIWVKSEKLY